MMKTIEMLIMEIWLDYLNWEWWCNQRSRKTAKRMLETNK